MKYILYPSVRKLRLRGILVHQLERWKFAKFSFRYFTSCPATVALHNLKHLDIKLFTVARPKFYVFLTNSLTRWETIYRRLWLARAGWFLSISSRADPGCLSRIWIFSIPDPASKKLSILTQKIVSKLSEIWSGMFLPDPDPWGILIFTHHGSRDQKDTGSATLV